MRAIMLHLQWLPQLIRLWAQLRVARRLERMSVPHLRGK